MDILAALENNGTFAQLNQAKGCEKPARTGSHHNHSLRMAYVGIFHWEKIQLRSRTVDVEIEREVDVDGALTGIDTTLSNAQVANGAYVDVQFFGGITFDAFLACCDVGRDADVELLGTIVGIVVAGVVFS